MALVQKVSALIKVLFLKGKALEGTCRIKVSREKSFLNLPSPWLLSSAGVHDPLGKGNCVPPHCSSEGPAGARPASSRTPLRGRSLGQVSALLTFGVRCASVRRSCPGHGKTSRDL